jgi:hypothetical protein
MLRLVEVHPLALLCQKKRRAVMKMKGMGIGGSVFIVSAVAATRVMGQTNSHLGGAYEFAPGSASFSAGSPTVTTTVEYSPNMGGITLPGFNYPELDPMTVTDTDDGFSLSGRYDFLDGSGTSAEVQITASRPVIVTGNLVETASDMVGYFGIDSTDSSPITSPVIGGPTLATAATLTSFTVSTYLVPSGGSMQNDISAADGSLGTVPLDVNFPDGALSSTGTTNGYLYDQLTGGDYDLVQTVTIDFSGLVPGESVDILLPEPSVLLTVPCIAGLFLLRRRSRRLA